MKLGDRVAMTPYGERMAKERKLIPKSGRVIDTWKTGQIYVQRDGWGCEWWPRRAWALVQPFTGREHEPEVNGG